MNAEILSLEPGSPSTEAIQQAAAILAQGGLVVFPTETVYGVGANAANPDALARLRRVKQRADSKPFTLHIGSRHDVDQYVPEVSGVARRFMDKAWPGPLSIVFPVADPQAAPVVRDQIISSADVLYHEGTIGIRCPDHPLASRVLSEAGVPIVAASANPGGGRAPLDAEEAAAALGADVDLIIDGGRARYGKASTIVRVAEGGIELLREGVIDGRTVQKLSKTNFLLVCSGNTCRSPMAEGLLRKLLAERLGCSEDELADRGYHIESAGTGAMGGSPPSEPAVQVLKKRGIDISGHRSSALDATTIHRADHLFTMTSNQLDMIAMLAGGYRGKASTLDGDRDVQDPIGGDESLYADCADQIERALKQRLEEIEL